MAKTFEKLDAWKQAIDIATEIYRITNKFPGNEIYGLTSQIRRAAVSVSSNIAEGSGLDSKQGFNRYLKIAIGSLNEVESLLIISNKLGFVTNDDYNKLNKSIEHERKMIYGLISYLKKKK